MINKADNTQSIDALDLSVRAHNVLWRANIRTIGDLKQLSYEDLLHVRNMGRRCAAEISKALFAYDQTELVSLTPIESLTSVSDDGISVIVGRDKDVVLSVSDAVTNRPRIMLNRKREDGMSDQLRIAVDLMSGGVSIYDASGSLNAYLQTDFGTAKKEN